MGAWQSFNRGPAAASANLQHWVRRSDRHTYTHRDGQRAYLADKALGVPLGVEGGDVVLHDGPAAAAALGSEHLKVVGPAVGLALLLVEAVSAELLAAVRAEKVFRVPRLLQGGHTFLGEKRRCGQVGWK